MFTGKTSYQTTSLDVLSWKFPQRPCSMLEIRTQSMDTNFYPNIELGGRGDFFQYLRPRLSELCHVTNQDDNT